MSTIRTALACLLWATVSPMLAADRYVDSAGSDAGDGSFGNPWRTLQHAAGEVGPGDRVIVAPGAYAGFHLTASGAADNPIEFLGQGGALINQQNPVTPDGINLEGASHVVVDGFTVVDMPRAGVRAVGNSSNFAEFVTVRNVVARDNFKWGIFTGFVDDLLIEQNETSGAEDEHGIYVSNSGDRPVIRNNEIWGNHANGIHINGDASLGGDGVISGAVVSSNVIYDNGQGGGSGINMDGVQDSRIENNLVYDTHASGISLYRIDGGAPSTGNLVVNNTVHVADDGRWALNIQNASADNTVRNNILLNEHSFRGALDISSDSLSGLDSDHNIVISRFTTNGGNSVLNLAEWQSLTGGDANSLVDVPGDLFFDWTTGDYDLLPTASAIDAGASAVAPATDLEGRPRPVGDGFYIGAVERSQFRADFNTDGAVDQLDLTQWQGDYGMNSFSDADDDEDSDGRDFLFWQAEHPGPALSHDRGFAIPEPASIVLALMAGVAVSGARATRSAAKTSER